MAAWVIPLYIFSGLLMVAGLYLSMKYHLYCTLKSPEREIAMELYRKKLTNSKMSLKEIEKYEFYRRDTKLYTIGMKTLFLSAPLHAFTLIIINHQFILVPEIYIVSYLFIVPIYVTSESPICLPWFIGADKETILKMITIYLKKNKGEFLRDKDMNFYKHEQSIYNIFIVMNFLFKIGVTMVLASDLVLIYRNI